MKELKIYKNLKVIVTGSTGFKGSWLCFWLSSINAKVIGISLKPEKGSIIFKKLGLEKKIKQIYLDINNFDKLNKIIKKEKPDIIFHLAAQSIVSSSYLMPLKTINTNIIGSTNILETVRINKIKNLVYITSDKCYLNDNRTLSYNEEDILGGEDPYSASKAGAELVFQTYFKSFFNNEKKLKHGSVRAGNVIGGGDFKKNRIVPDVVKSYYNKKNLIIRNPNSTRPWQHVLEPLSGYLILGNLLINKKLSQSIRPNWNFGPSTSNCRTVLEVVKKIISLWGEKKKINIIKSNKFKETNLLMLSSKKAKDELSWKSRLTFEETIQMTVDWYKLLFSEEKVEKITRNQIDFFSNKQKSINSK